jgi:4-aminobutyrate aminotransferase/(S)-3-amino-2-methylpropionate transaminase
VGRADVMDAARPGTIGGTYGGNPVACAAALATIELMQELRLAEKAQEIGKTLRERFLALQRRCPAVIGDVRGQGAMQAIELVEEADPERPATKLVGDVIEACVERGLLVLSAGTYGNVIRVLAPLVIRPEDLERGLAILEEALLARVPRAATPTRRSPPSRGRRGRA